jgi:hypothetical protein
MRVDTECSKDSEDTGNVQRRLKIGDGKGHVRCGPVTLHFLQSRKWCLGDAESDYHQCNKVSKEEIILSISPPPPPGLGI